MRAKNKIFHLDCFRCVACEKQLIPGDEFALRRDGLFCKEDHQVEIHPGGGGGPGSNTVSPIPPDSSRPSIDMKMNANLTKDSLENNNNNTILGLQGAGAGGQQMQLMHNTSNSSEDNSEGMIYILIICLYIMYNYISHCRFIKSRHQFINNSI